jgi:hypothetical protein
MNADLPIVTLKVSHAGGRPIQVCSHPRFFEVNQALQFDRALARQASRHFTGHSGAIGARPVARGGACFRAGVLGLRLIPVYTAKGRTPPAPHGGRRCCGNPTTMRWT